MDAATIEETNKLRLSMGLKPLPVPGAADSSDSASEDEDPQATYEGREAQGVDNYQKLREAENAKKAREERTLAIKRAREKAQLNVQLEGKGLGDLDGDDVGARDWLKGQKSRQKKIAKSRADEEAADAARKTAEYTSQDLTGLNVGHDVSALLDGDEQVLTLRDTGVLENEEDGDELENTDLREREKREERLNLKRKPQAYNPNDLDESGNLLGQYDDEIYGKKKIRFALDTGGSITDLSDILNGPLTADRKAVKLETLDDAPASDYLDISEIKIKKPKKKKKSRATRQRAADDDDALYPGDSHAGEATQDQDMDIDSGPQTWTKKRRHVDEAYVDDDDLQASLATQRRDALKKRKRIRPEDLAKQAKADAEREAEEAAGQGGENGTGLVLDEITEFVGALKRGGDEDAPGRVKKSSAEPVTTSMEDEEDQDRGEPDTHMVDATEEKEEEAEDQEWTTTGVDDEKFVGQGLGAAMSLLRDRGIIQDSGTDLNAKWRKHEQFVAERNRRLAQIEEDAKKQREKERNSGYLDKMTPAEREQYRTRVNQQREHQTSKVLQEMFQKDYTPNFNIQYVDEHGRQLDQRDAWKQLSWAFHGKTPGKGKTSKMLKKMADEKKAAAEPILEPVDKSSGSGPQKRAPGVRLS